MKPYVLLVAIDMKPGSATVLDEALRIASHHKPTDMHVLAVAEPALAVGLDMTTAPYAELNQIDMTQLSNYIRERVDAFHTEHPDLSLPRIEAHRSIGRPADEIVWLAAHLDAENVVLGSHNRKGLVRFLLGSVAEKVVRVCGCRVTVVREKNHKSEWRVPEIEPLCPDCATIRKDTAGEKLWCARHSEHHVRAHVYSSSSPDGPHAWESTTGT